MRFKYFSTKSIYVSLRHCERHREYTSARPAHSAREPASRCDFSGKLPRGTIGPRHQFCRTAVIDDLFLCHIPLDFAADQHRNETEMPRKRGMVRRFDGRNCRLAGFHAVEKIALMAVRLIQLNFAQFLRQRFALDPSWIRGIDPRAIHPYPSVGAYPLGSHADCGRTAGDRDCNIDRITSYFFSIFTFDVVFRSRIPNGIGCREFAVPFNLRWTGVIESQAPMRDVAVVADPIHQLSAAGVVVPSPVLIDAGFDVRFGLGGTQPPVKVKGRRRLRYS